MFIPRRTPSIHGALAASVVVAALAIPGAPAVASSYNWAAPAAGVAAWNLPANWNVPAGYPGSNPSAVDAVTIAPAASLGGTLTIVYSGAPAPSLASLTLARGFMIGGDELHLSVQAPMTVAGTLTLDGGSMTNGSRSYLDVHNSSSFGALQVARSVTADATANAPGARFFAGATTVGALQVGLATSSTPTTQVNVAGAVTLSGGTLTVTGPFIVGQQNSRDVPSGLFVTGGTLIATEPTGLAVARALNPNLGAASGIFEVSGGTVFLPQLSLGGTQTSTQVVVTRNRAHFTLSSGVVYLGSGGLVATSSSGVNGSRLGSEYLITLSGGTLGATASWSSSAKMTFASGMGAFCAGDPAQHPSTITLSGYLQGPGGLLKTGPGTLILAGSANAYTGPTVVAEGTLLAAAPLHSATHTGPISVGAGATYGGVGNTIVVGDVTVNAGGHISPGLPGTNEGVGTLYLNNLTLAGGAFLDMDFASDGVSNDLIVIYPGATLTLGSPVYVNLFQLGQPFSQHGTYTLFSGVSAPVGSLDHLQVYNPVPGMSYRFDLEGADLQLTVGGSTTGPADGTWVGNLGADWGNSGNWVGHVRPGETAGDRATFPDARSSSLVQLNGSRRVGSWSMAAGTNSGYTFVAGTAGSSLLLDNGTSPSQVTVTSGLHTATHEMVLLSPPVFTVSPGSQLTLAGAVHTGTASPASLTLAGGGTLVLTGTTAFSGTTVLTAGTLRVGGSGTLGGVSGPGALHIDEGATVTSDGVTAGDWRIHGVHVIRTNGSSTGTSRVGWLTLAGVPGAWTGKLDLQDNALILASANEAAQSELLARLREQVASGRAGGTWSGHGITNSLLAGPAGSDHTLAVVDAGDLSLSAFRGQTGLDGQSSVVVAALLGDATLDGKVDAFDLNVLAAHWQMPEGAWWSDGDFTGDGKVDAFDLNVVASRWQAGVRSYLTSTLQNLSQINSSTIPEPASLTIFAIAISAFLIKRYSSKKVSN